MPSASWWRGALTPDPQDWRHGGFALYVHWPFCEAKCPYCDFNSHVTAQIDQARWARALASEVARVAALTPGRVLSSIFFGGGTPSLMTPATVDTILRAARDGWPWANDIEITLEANPRSVEAARFAGFAEAGVNRVSLGVQALNDADLKRLGRLHGAAETMAAFDTARAQFSRVSFDLIYARQDQTLADWNRELTRALDMAVDHLSLYQLTIEPGTAFGARAAAGGLRGLPDEDLAADMYELTQMLCSDAGYTAYEVSNHARPGAESRHNLIYWRSGDWAGIGPGAHGRLTLGAFRVATETPLSPLGWLRQVETTGTGEGARESVGPEDAQAEAVMMGLRLVEGVAEDALGSEKRSTINGLVSDGLLRVSHGRVQATPEGRLVLNRITGALLT